MVQPLHSDRTPVIRKGRRTWYGQRPREIRSSTATTGLHQARDAAPRFVLKACAEANRPIAGLGDLLADQAARIGVRGTFVAANVLGLQAGGVTGRMANGIDKIERNPIRCATRGGVVDRIELPRASDARIPDRRKCVQERRPAGCS